jgi:hypothetical protein
MERYHEWKMCVEDDWKMRRRGRRREEKRRRLMSCSSVSFVISILSIVVDMTRITLVRYCEAYGRMRWRVGG